jgi:hypothetical protein
MKASVLWAAACLCAGGCVVHSNVGNESDGSILNDGGKDAGHDAGSCGPGNCSGCCEGTTCLQGISASACGVGGASCATCGSGSFCDGAGACRLTDGGACGPGNCSGCCVGTACFPGDVPAECGTGGAACSACQPDWVCGTGSCQPGPGDGGWTIVPSGTLDDLRGVWAVPGLALAVGANGTILRWDGGTWAPGVQGLAPYDLWGVWGASSTQAWAVGSGGVILQWNGSSWSGAPGMPFPHVDFRGVAGASASDVWAVGIDTSNGQFGAVALHWDGSNWFASNTALTGAYPLIGVAASSSGAVAVSPGPWLIHTVGAATYWAQATPSLAPTTLSSGVSNFQDTWVTTADGGVFNTIGGSWNGTPTGVSSDLRSVTVIPPNHDVWAVGDQGAIVHSFAGSAWSISVSGTPENLHSVWAASSNELWAVGDMGTILHNRPKPPVWTACGSGQCDMSSETCVYPCCGGIPLPDGGVCTPPPPYCVATPSACQPSVSCACFASDPCAATGGTCEGPTLGGIACVCA